MNRPQVRRRRLWQGGALAVAAVLTVGLAQSTTTAAFTARTSDTANQVTAKPSFCMSSGPTTLTVAADTAVWQDRPNSRLDASDIIGVASGNGADGHTYLRFDLAARAPLPHRCEVTSARLQVYATDSAPSRTLEAHRADRSWTPAVTWNTVGRPRPTGTPSTTESLGRRGWQEWDVTALTRQLYAGPDHGFLLKDRDDGAATTRYQLWSSMEADSNPARLTITWG